MPRDIEKGLEAGFFRYLTKPIKVKEFMDTLDVALEFAAQGFGQAREAGGSSLISPSDIFNARILIVDDQEANVLLLERCCAAPVIPPSRPRWIRARSVSCTGKTATT